MYGAKQTFTDQAEIKERTPLPTTRIVNLTTSTGQEIWVEGQLDVHKKITIRNWQNLIPFE